MSAATELAATLRQLAIGEADHQLADMLLETVQKIAQHADAKLRSQAQGAIGDTYITIQERLDALLNIGRDTHQLVMSVQLEQQGQGAAVGELRAEFQEVGESLSGMRADIADLKTRDAQHDAERAADRRELREKADRAKQDIARINQALDDRPSPEEIRRLHAAVAELRARLDARPSPAEARATYNGVRRILDHLGLPLDADEASA